METRILSLLLLAACAPEAEPQERANQSSAALFGIGTDGDPDETESPADTGEPDAPITDTGEPDEPITNPGLSSGDVAALCVAEPTAALAQCAPGVAAVASGAAFPTISSALGTSAAVVYVCPGTWDEHLAPEDEVTLASASGDPADTVLTGGGQHRIITSAEPLTVVGLTFVDGHDGYDGGAISSGPITVSCSVFQDNVADYEGGALQIRGDATIQRTVFFGNYADYEGGAISWGDWDPFSLQIEDSLFEQNEADYEGGAIEIGTWADTDQIEILGTTFRENASAYGQGVVNFGSWGGFTGVIDACAFEDNDYAIATDGWLKQGYSLTVTNTSIVGAPGDW